MKRVPVLYAPAEFGAALRRVRTEAGVTQADLAERLGVNRMTVSRLEQGDAVSLETAIRALSELGHALAVVPKFARVSAEAR